MSSDSNLMSMLNTKMRYLTQRQGVLSQNIANIDTPGYKSRDLKKIDFNDMAKNEMGKLSLATTSPKHIRPNLNNGPFGTEENRKPFEVTPTKNSVSLDEEMAKISDTGSEYQLSSSMYKKFVSMYRAALGNR